MPYDSGGTFTRANGTNGWQADATAGIKILASLHDTHDQDLASGLSQCLLRNGQGVPTADIPWGGMKITNLATPTAPQDAATKAYVDDPDPKTKALDLNGANLEGRLNFTAMSGVNGITWNWVDMALVGRNGDASKTSKRLVVSNTDTPPTGGSGSATDIFTIDDGGRLDTATGTYTHNLSWDGSQWRTVDPGIGTRMQVSSNALALSGLDVATLSAQYQPAPLREFFRATNAAGSAIINLVKTASGDGNYLRSLVGSAFRWELRFGDTTAESGTYKGSDFALYRYNNSGTTPVEAFRIERENGNATFGGAIISSIVSGPVDGTITLRPDGPASTTGEFIVENTGDIEMSGDSIEVKGALLKLSCKTTGDVYIRPHGETVQTGETHFMPDGNIVVTGSVSMKAGIPDLVLAGADTGTVTLRPDGPASTTGELVIDNTGDVLISGDSIETKGALFKLSTAVAGDIYLRPNGETSVVGQLRVNAAGDALVTGDIETTNGIVRSKFTTMPDLVLAGGSASVGRVLLRPRGDATATGEAILDKDGNLSVAGTITSVGAITSATSAVKTDANIAYTGTSAANVAFPIGSTILAFHTVALARNAVAAIGLSTFTGMYEVGAASTLTGTWNVRGVINLLGGVYFHLFQRTA